MHDAGALWLAGPMKGFDPLAAFGPSVAARYDDEPRGDEEESAACLARLADGGFRIVAVRQGSLLATSFLPEITGDRRIHELFVDLVRQG